MDRRGDAKSREMMLDELLGYDHVTIQCHDNPDADAIASGYGLYCFFRDKGKDTRLLYSGRNKVRKANLMLMVEKLHIPLEYQPQMEDTVDGLLITVDCQYGAGNVTKIPAEEIAVIDHHPLEVICTERMRLQPNMGSCATLVWTMLQEMHYPVEKNRDLGTALYYGLYMDTNQFSELSNPVDMDMRESLNFDKNQISLFRNSNISLRELEIAGVAMLRCNYNDDYQFAVIHSQPCDPNVLGLISDFLLQVAGVNTCVVYNEDSGGYKFSVRSCIREVNASELSDYLSEGIGSGGGHYEKAGGYISMKLYEEKYPTLHSEAYFNNRMTQYFDTFRILYAKDRAFPVSEGTRYQRKKIPLACVRASDLAELGRVVSVRTQNGTMDIDTRQNICYTLERNGELHRVAGERFHRILELSDAPVSEDYCRNMTYVPRVKDGTDGRNHLITEYVRMCMPKDEFRIYAIRVTQRRLARAARHLPVYRRRAHPGQLDDPYRDRRPHPRLLDLRQPQHHGRLYGHGCADVRRTRLLRQGHEMEDRGVDRDDPDVHRVPVHDVARLVGRDGDRRRDLRPAGRPAAARAARRGGYWSLLRAVRADAHRLPLHR